MRFVWTDAGDDPTWETGDKHGIDGYFAPLFDEPLSTAVIVEAGNRGHAQGAYFGHNWMSGAAPETIVARVNTEYKRIVKVAPRLRVMFNLEEHDPDFVADVLEEWRRVQPRVNTSWSPEGMQGGWMSPEFVERVLACRVRVVPQGFWGAAGGIAGDWAHDQVLRDLTRCGFPEHVVSIFHDGKTLAQKREAEGFVFTMGRLPA
jgi:hypothetical protein